MDESRTLTTHVSPGIPVAKENGHENEPQRPRFYARDDAAAYWVQRTDFIISGHAST